MPMDGPSHADFIHCPWELRGVAWLGSLVGSGSRPQPWHPCQSNQASSPFIASSLSSLVWHPEFPAGGHCKGRVCASLQSCRLLSGRLSYYQYHHPVSNQHLHRSICKTHHPLITIHARLCRGCWRASRGGCNCPQITLLLSRARGRPAGIYTCPILCSQNQLDHSSAGLKMNRVSVLYPVCSV